MITTLFCLLALTDPEEWNEFARLAADRDPDRRVQAVERIRSRRDPRMVRFLLPLMADGHPRVRARAAAALRGLSDEPSAVPLMEGARRHASPLVRSGICEILGGIKGEAAVQALLEALKDRDPSVRAQAAASLKEAGPIREAFDREPDGLARALMLEALLRLKGTEPPEKAASDGDYRVRLVAAEAAPQPCFFQDRDWRVRLAAIQGARRQRLAAAIGPMAERLGQERGRLLWETRAALVDLAGRDLGPDPAPWLRWWEVNRNTFKPSVQAGPEVNCGTQATFFRSPILSECIVFVLDLSGSMRDPAPGGAGTKLDAAKKGMVETIRSLPPTTRFAILGLGSDADGAFTQRERKTWGRQAVLRPAAPGNKADAERFIRGLEARGWTNLYDGIEYAFSVPDADSFYIYTDGGASTGTFVASGEIAARVARLNRFRKIALHTVEVPGLKNPEDNRRLLRRLASDSAGTYLLAD